MIEESLMPRIEAHTTRYKEIETLLGDPDVAADQRRFVKLTKEYKHLGQLMHLLAQHADQLSNIEFYQEVIELDESAAEVQSATDSLTAARAEVERLEEEIKLFLLPSDPEDDKNVILEVRAGTGGDEAALFAGDITKMYLKFCERHGWAVAITSESPGAVGGYKEVVMSVSGDGVYGILKYESGVHRVQRVPATETQGRVHTSAATVAVLPEAEPFEVEINEGEIKWDTFRSGGAGGQNVNKVESGVRLRYQFTDPYTGEKEEILIENTETRDQPKNKENALRQLRSILYDKELQHRMAEQAKVEAGKMKIEWGSQIRSYVFDDRRVKDHRTGFQTSDVGGVMDGDIDGFIKAYLMEFAGKINEES